MCEGRALDHHYMVSLELLVLGLTDPALTEIRDIYYEKAGFMIIFWTMAGVPFSYAHSIIYVAKHDPSEYLWPSWFALLLIVPYLGVYYVWDTCNSQKNQFRQEERGEVDERTTFPYFKYGKLHNPETIETKSGKKLLCDGWCEYIPPFLLRSFAY
jgi:delta24(24(1))-sterol reductase